MIRLTVARLYQNYLYTMQMKNVSLGDFYFTQDHEWIVFSGTIAHIGVCAFKLTGFKEVKKIRFHKATGLKRKGELLATIYYKDYQVAVHMPADGKIMQLNQSFAEGQYELLLQDPEGAGWLARIAPTQPYDRTDLLLAKEYQLNGKSKYAKS